MQKSDFDEMPDPTEFEQMYIGIGAKYYKYADYPKSVNTGAFQLYPNFINCENPTLIIIIDPQLDFAKETQSYVEKSILYARDVCLQNTTFIMINSDFDEIMSEKLVSYLERRTSVNNLWICSFVTFISPSSREQKIENDIDAFFAKTNMPYKNNSYKWLGIRQPYILRKYSVPSILFSNIIGKHEAVSRITPIPIIKPDTYLNFCYDTDFETSTRDLLEYRKWKK
jgi:hypothetical protein